jgi:hypothetical protein
MIWNINRHTTFGKKSKMNWSDSLSKLTKGWKMEKKKKKKKYTTMSK